MAKVMQTMKSNALRAMQPNNEEQCSKKDTETEIQLEAFSSHTRICFHERCAKCFDLAKGTPANG